VAFPGGYKEERAVAIARAGLVDAPVDVRGHPTRHGASPPHPSALEENPRHCRPLLRATRRSTGHHSRHITLSFSKPAIPDHPLTSERTQTLIAPKHDKTNLKDPKLLHHARATIILLTVPGEKTKQKPGFTQHELHDTGNMHNSHSWCHEGNRWSWRWPLPHPGWRKMGIKPDPRPSILGSIRAQTYRNSMRQDACRPSCRNPHKSSGGMQ
jgi:hypothetical protein